jgi:hypothetical protein
MKSLPKITRQQVYIVILIVLITLTVLSLPRQVGALQTTPDPTPTITPTFPPGEEPLKSGETGGLMLGAAVIFGIIITGVWVQRLLQKHSPPSQV